MALVEEDHNPDNLLALLVPWQLRSAGAFSVHRSLR